MTMPPFWFARRKRKSVRSPACTFSNVMSCTGSPSANGCPIFVSSSVAAARMSIVSIDAPTDSARAIAFDFVCSRGREPRHRVREDVAARPAHPVHRPGDHEQGVRRVQAAAHADDRLRPADRLHALHEPRDLDVERLVAVLREPGRVVGHEREAVERAAEPDVPGGRIELEVHGAEHRVGVLGAPVVVERPLAQAILPQPVEVDVRDRAARGPPGSARSRPGACRPRRSWSGRPTTGRSWTRPRRPRRRRRRRGTAATATGRGSCDPRRARS